MTRPIRMTILTAAMAALSFLCSDAQAGWGWGGGGSCGSWGGHRFASYGSGGWYGGGNWGGSYGSYGGYARVRHGSWGSYGSYGSYGRARGYGGGYRGHYGGRYYAGGGRYGGYASARRRIVKRPVTYVASASAHPKSAERSRAALAVTVPANATVYVNDVRTKSTGEQRLFLSSLLTAGEAARFEVRAVVDGDEQTKVVTVTPGNTREVAFALGVPQSVQTALILHVPTDSIVQIEGRTMKKTGTRRVLTTHRVPVGKKLNGLNVLVSLDRNGRTLTKETQVTLHGGRQHELTVEFDEAALAKR